MCKSNETLKIVRKASYAKIDFYCVHASNFSAFLNFKFAFALKATSQISFLKFSRVSKIQRMLTIKTTFLMKKYNFNACLFYIMILK